MSTLNQLHMKQAHLITRSHYLIAEKQTNLSLKLEEKKHTRYFNVMQRWKMYFCFITNLQWSHGFVRLTAGCVLMEGILTC